LWRLRRVALPSFPWSLGWWLSVDAELRDRILLAVLESLKDGDPVLLIGVGDNELRISHG
jgi:hypothetical protein